MTVRLEPSPCPHCGAIHTAVAGAALRGAAVDEPVPDPGDVTLCIGCGEWCVFDERLALRAPTDAEICEIAMNELCRYVRQAWVETRRREVH